MADHTNHKEAKLAFKQYPKDAAKVWRLTNEYLYLKNDLERYQLDAFTETLIRKRMAEVSDGVRHLVFATPFLIHVRNFAIDVFVAE